MLMNECTKARLGYLGTVEGKAMYDVVRNNLDTIIDMFKDIEPDENKCCETNREYFKAKRGNKYYYIFN